MKYSSFVEYIVLAIVDTSGKVQIEEVEDQEQGVVTCYVHVDPADVGKVIGRNGKVITAIRQIVSAIASKKQQKAFVKVVTE
jgi:hypothetical protein